jgi:outer membrane protein assembly factor BamB
VLADGKIYATSEDGTTTVVSADGDFKILAVNKLNDYTLASPAVAGENIFIRTANFLYCLGKKNSSAD